MIFDATKKFDLSVQVTETDWEVARLARQKGKAEGYFNVCYACAAGQAINRALRDAFPDAEAYATCAPGSAIIRQHKDGYIDGVDGEMLMQLDPKIPVDIQLTRVVNAFDSRAGIIEADFTLHFAPIRKTGGADACE